MLRIIKEKLLTYILLSKYRKRKKNNKQVRTKHTNIQKHDSQIIIL